MSQYDSLFVAALVFSHIFTGTVADPDGIQGIRSRVQKHRRKTGKSQ
jgi:hypothetical protein